MLIWCAQKMKFTFIPINVRGGNKKPFIYLYIVRWMDLTIFIGGQIAWLNAMRILEINSNQVKIQFYDDYINSAIWFRFFLHFKIFDSINLLSSAFKQRRELIHTHTHIPKRNPGKSITKPIQNDWSCSDYLIYQFTFNFLMWFFSSSKEWIILWRTFNSQAVSS